MTSASLVASLEHDHHVVDHAIDVFLAAGAERESGALLQAIAGLRRHIYIEEELVFPALWGSSLRAPVLVMLREHAQIWQTLASLTAELYAAPGAATAAALCRQLASQLLHHNVKEERVIYAAAVQLIPDTAALQLATAADALGEIPAGWTCLRARC